MGRPTALEGEPVLVVRDGRPLEEAMRVERLSLRELHEAAREQGIGDLDQIEAAILEPDGRFSIITRDRAQHRPDETDVT